ncbi:MAG: formimidoylglutamase [Bacteroidales bacterium]|nr:formimidoylglutamase [Bacteroidales bacterium]
MPYFNPVQLDDCLPVGDEHQSTMLCNCVVFNDQPDGAEPVLSEYDFVIIGVPESRNAYNNSSAKLAPDEIRRQFYQLYSWDKEVRIFDMGNLIIGDTPEDTYEILSEILSELIELNVFPIILGGSNDLAYANYLAYSKLEQVVNIVSVDSRFDIGKENQPISSVAYLNKIIMEKPNFLMNYSNVGYQTYMNSPEERKLMEQLFLDAYRVGMMRYDLNEVEPIMRNAEMVAMDISAVRRPDAPGNPNGSSNGFYGEEICQVARFAGLNDKLTSFGIYEYDPTLDYNNQTSQLIGHILWYLIEGWTSRVGDAVFQNKNDYVRYTVPVSQAIDVIVFYCSKRTRRWWMAVPIVSLENDLKQQYFLPCSEKDYQTACKDIIPEKWWKTYNKINR